MSEVIVALSTTSSIEEAKRIARTLVEERLAACVNIVPGVTSIYRWEGSIHEDGEYLLVIKSSTARADELRERFLSLHSYEVAEFVVLDVSAISEPYAKWISESTSG